MMIEMQFNSIAQLQRLQEIASSCDDEIFLHSLDDSVRVDAKSFIGLFTLDFTQPVKVVTDSEVLPKSWTKVMRQSHFEFCIGQDLTHSIFL